MLIRQSTTAKSPERAGYVLLAVLVVIAVLSLAAYRYSDMTTAEYRATENILKNTQAKALADSGIHYSVAMLSDPDAYANALGSNPFNNQGAFGNIPVDLGNGRTGYFSVMCLDYSQDASQGSLPQIYGVADEAAKINLNAVMQIDPSGTVAYNMLMMLPNMTDDVANSILDWIDTDEDPRSDGAESSYYEALSPNPYSCKDAPLDSIEELLLVKGVTPDLLYGNDLNRNGILDGDELTAGGYNPGWAPYLTVYSREMNVSSAGTPRININDSNLPGLYATLQGIISPEMAAYVVAFRLYGPPPANSKAAVNPANVSAQKVAAALTSGGAPPRSQRNIASIYQLVGSSVLIPGQRNQPDVIFKCPIQDVASASTDLPTLADNTTTVANMELPARINIMTASPTVLACLPGLAASDVNAIIAARPAVGSSDAAATIYQTTAWLYLNASISAAQMMALDRYITVRTQVYRAQAVGYFEKGGPVSRIEAVIDTNSGQPRITYYRDLTDLGRAIDPRNN